LSSKKSAHFGRFEHQIADFTLKYLVGATSI
jgi:hypothetical protein